MPTSLSRPSKSASLVKSTSRIALIGCGAIAELFYLPAIAKQPSVLGSLILVDSNLARAREMAAGFGVDDCRIDYRQVIGEVDGAIIAVPTHLHYPLSMDFLSHGVHVLCEKPLALSAVEAREMIRQSRQAGAKLCVNYTRRLFASSLKVKELLSKGVIGDPLSITYVEGEEFSWPTASGFYFNSKVSRRGVLLDRGAHILDLICWWLEGKPNLTFFQNDSFGGCEAVAHVELEHRGCIAEVNLSLFHKLRNCYRIEGEAGTIEGGIYDWRRIAMTTGSSRKRWMELRPKETDYHDFGQRVVAGFLDVIAKGEQPLIPASDVLKSMELIDECYENAARFSMPWYETLGVFNGE